MKYKDEAEMHSIWNGKPPSTHRKIWRNDTLTTTKPARIGLGRTQAFVMIRQAKTAWAWHVVLKERINLVVH